MIRVYEVYGLSADTHIYGYRYISAYNEKDARIRAERSNYFAKILHIEEA